MADELENNGQQVQGTSGHESETVSVGGLKASLQKLKTDHIDTKYTKPSGGIPSTDMTSAVQSSLGKADAAKALLDDIVPAQASDQNQLADKSFVNSSVSTATATHRGTFNLVSDLSLTVSATQSQIATALGTAIQTADNNDYAFVQVPTADDNPTEIARVDRYKHNGTAWAFEYSLNNSGYTAAQWAAINSAITSAKVSGYDSHVGNSDIHVTTQNKTAWNAKYDKPSGGIPKTDLSSGVQSSLDKADAAAPQSTTYSKTEVDQKFDEFAGPTYDPATRAIIFPATAKVSYDAANRAVVFG